MTQPEAGGGSDTDNTIGDQTTEYYESGTYTNVQGAPNTRSSNWYSHSLLNVTDGGTDITPQVGDPGTTFTLTQTNGVTEEDWAAGTSGFSTPNSSFSTNFTQKKTTWSTLAFEMQSDRWDPVVPSQIAGGVWDSWNGIPDSFGLEQIVTAISLFVSEGPQTLMPPRPDTSNAESSGEADYTVSDLELTTGTTSGGSNVASSTSTNTTETDTIDQTASIEAASPGGYTPQSGGLGAVFSGWATAHEVDKESGGNRFATPWLNYDDVISQSASYSLFATTGAPSPADGVMNRTDSRSMTSTTTMDGSYVMNPPLVLSQPTLDDPTGAYATINDRRQNNVSVTQSVSQHDSGTASPGTYTRDYTGTVSSSLTSDHTLTVIGVSGTDMQGGSYTRVGEKMELSGVNGEGSEGDSSGGESWHFSNGLYRSESVNDKGTYPYGGTQTVTIGAWESWWQKITVWESENGLTYSNTTSYGTGGPSPGYSTTSGPDTPPQIPLTLPDPPPYTWESFLDDTQIVLTVVGFVPGPIGVAADLINAAISYKRGDYLDMTMNLISAIPGLGDVLGGGAKLAGKVGKEVLEHGDDALKLARAGINKVDDVGEGAGKIMGKANDVIDASKIKCAVPDDQFKILGVDYCFVTGTLAPSELGDRPVETVKSGQRMFGFDLVSGEWRLCTVLDVFESDYAGESIEISGAFGRIESTQHHPFWVVEGEDLDARSKPDHLASASEEYPSIPGRWVDAHDLRVGDVLFLRGGRRAAIEAIASRQVATKVYNFRVDGLHNYAVGAGGVLVHNGCKVGKAAVTQEAKGGVYVLKDGNTIVRTGRTKNLAAREAQLARHPVLGDYKFKAVYHTDDYATQRGLEQILYDLYPKARFNLIRAIRENNPNIEGYMAAAATFLEKLKL